jgi:lipid-A-disaccharide synthase
MTAKHVFIVAGEASGDLLGAGLIRELKSKYGDAIRFSGIAGDKMQAEGCESVYPMERLAVMGIVAVLLRYRELTQVRKRLIQELIANPPDLFIGIDAPEFNLDFELTLKQAGIKTLHYVSPSVWAWRPKRIFKIKQAVDHMLCLFTFEEAYYQQHQIPVTCVGHPLADQIPLQLDQDQFKGELNIASDTPVLAVLPGSRFSELKYIAEPFLKTAALCQQAIPNLQIVVPLVNEVRKRQFEQIYQRLAVKPQVKITVGNARDVMAASDAVLIASGTATLEATLLKKPMVVGYKMSGFSYGIFSRMLKIKNVSLPNLLAGKAVVKELIQSQCQPELLAEALLPLFEKNDQQKAMIDEFTQIHMALKKNASRIAANVVTQLLENRL